MMNSSSYYMWDSCPSLPKESLLNSIPDSSSAQGTLLSLPWRAAPGHHPVCNPGTPWAAGLPLKGNSLSVWGTQNAEQVKEAAVEPTHRLVLKLVTRREDELWWRDFTCVPFQEGGWGVFRWILDTQISTGCALMGCQCPLRMISNSANAMLNNFKESCSSEWYAKLIVLKKILKKKNKK